MLVAWQSAAGFVFGYAQHLFGAYHTRRNVTHGHVTIHEYPPLNTEGEDDDDEAPEGGGENLAKLVGYEFRLFAMSLRIHHMDTLVQFIRAPCVVEHKHGGNDNQREGWLELANYPPYQAAKGER